VFCQTEGRFDSVLGMATLYRFCGLALIDGHGSSLLDILWKCAGAGRTFESVLSRPLLQSISPGGLEPHVGLCLAL